MELDAVQDSFRFYFHRGRIPFSLIHKPLKLKCLNEIIIIFKSRLTYPARLINTI